MFRLATLPSIAAVEVVWSWSVEPRASVNLLFTSEKCYGNGSQWSMRLSESWPLPTALILSLGASSQRQPKPHAHSDIPWMDLGCWCTVIVHNCIDHSKPLLPLCPMFLCCFHFLSPILSFIFKYLGAEPHFGFYIKTSRHCCNNYVYIYICIYKKNRSLGKSMLCNECGSEIPEPVLSQRGKSPQHSQPLMGSSVRAGWVWRPSKIKRGVHLLKCTSRYVWLFFFQWRARYAGTSWVVV